jgi:hypothetical protein
MSTIPSPGDRRDSDLTVDSPRSDVESKKPAPSGNWVHYDEWEGLSNVAGDTAGLPASVESTLFKFGVVDEKVPEVCGARRYFSVITGFMGMVKGSQMYTEASKANYVWGQTEGVIRVSKGLIESIVGLMSGTLAMVSTFASGFDSSAMAISSQVSDALFCLSMLCLTVQSLHNARLTGDLKRQLEGANDLKAKKAVLIAFSNDRENGGEMKLKKFTGLDWDQIHTLDETEVEKLISKLKRDEFNKALIGTLALLTAVLVVVGDVVTAGSISQGVSIAKLVVSSIFTIYDIYQLRDGLSTDNKRTSIDKFIQIALTVVSIGICAAVLVAGNIATGGGLSIGLHVLTIAVPLIAMLIANRHEIANLLAMTGKGLQRSADFIGQQMVHGIRNVTHGLTEAGLNVVNSLLILANYFDPTRFVARAIPEDVITL